MERRFILYCIFSGGFSGVIIGVVFKLVEFTTGIKVYTLLLNIDFIPIVNEISFPEFIEFLFHLIVSVILTFIFFSIAERASLSNGKAMLMITVMSVIVGFAIYPITSFSTRTPHILSIPAITWWTAGHILYGFVLGLLFISKNRI